jgi:hypothetical protein
LRDINLEEVNANQHKNFFVVKITVDIILIEIKSREDFLDFPVT